MKNNYFDQILLELKVSLSNIDDDSVDQLLGAMISSKRIFLAGSGRSGLMLKCFAMRLMHLGFDAFVVGETTTPGITSNDLLMIGSGSGETGSATVFAREARRQNAKLGVITSFPDSSIGKLANIKVIIRPGGRNPGLGSGLTSIQPGATLFEQSLLLLLDGMILKLIEKQNGNPGSMQVRHANLE